MKRCYSCFQEFDEINDECPYCGQVYDQTPREPIHLMPGTVLANRYIVGKEVGSGGFGIVYAALDTKWETIVAVKEFFISRIVARAESEKSLTISKKSQEEYEYRKERFLAEARNMAKFGSHPAIPNVFEYFEENNTAYIVMELLNGVPLNKYLNEHGGKLNIDFALFIANEVSKALKSLHENKIIHRDVAPDNIYICSEKDIKIKLMDLGAAKLEDSSDDVIDIVLKPGYSPTEQYDNSKNIGPWTDIYALGATLYLMITGVKPDESTNRKIDDTVVPPHKINPLVSENLSNAIMKAIAIEKHMRFKGVDDFLAAINGDRKIVTLAKEKKRRGIKRVFGVIAACLVLIVGVFAGMNIYNAKKTEQYLKPAEFSVWFSVSDDSSEEDAMNSIKSDFESTFPDIRMNLTAIPEAEYEKTICEAAEAGKLPALFESTGLPDSVLNKARDLDSVINSSQFDSALFLDSYEQYYTNSKQIPLAIEVPMAYVITNGAAFVDYSERTFESLSDFGNGTNVSYDERYVNLIKTNFSLDELSKRSAFMDNENNTSPVLLSSTMILNEVRTTLSNYEKAYVYPNCEKIYCRFTYEWSIGVGNENEIAAAERLLSWMLGNVYQSTLMINKCNDGQIPVNAICFDSKTETKNLLPIRDIYTKFSFERND